MHPPSNGILIVDDSKLIGNKLQEAIREIGGFSRVDQAYTVSDGLEMFLRLRPVVVILDIGFTRSSGLSLLVDIRQADSTVKIIMFSNYTHSMYYTRCMQAGADYFLDKSKDYEVLIGILEKHKSTAVSPGTIL